MKIRIIFNVRSAVTAVTLLFAVAIPAHTNIIVVTNTNDSGPGSLRQAIMLANNGDMIDFDPALNGQSVTLTSDELLISKNIAISGPGANLLTVARAQGVSNFRIFHITPSHTVTVQGLTITNGSPGAGFGGGILNDGGTLSVINCTLSGNHSPLSGGAIDNFAGESSATLTVESSTLTGNLADDYGGGIANLVSGPNNATLTINNSTLSANTGLAGGGIVNLSGGGSALMTVSNTTFSGNVAQFGGGIGNARTSFGAAIVDIGNTIFKSGASGENILNNSGSVISRGYSLSDDDAGGFLTGPGDQINTDPLLGPLQDNGGPTFTHALLPSSLAIDAGDPNFTPPPFFDQRGLGFNRVVNGRIDKGSFEVQPHGPVVTNTNDSGPGSLREALAVANDGDTITFAVTGAIGLTSGELVITKNITISGPGANTLTVRRDSATHFRIFHVMLGHTVTIEGLRISNGSVLNGFGGGILNFESTLTVNSCALAGNSALGQPGLGGGIFSNGSGGGGAASLTITNSVFSGNAATTGGAVGNDGASGMASLTISNSTLSGNSAKGIFSDVTASITITNSTLSENTSASISMLSGMLEIANTIMRAAASGVNLDIGKLATVTSHGYNLSSDDAGGFFTGPGDQINTAPLLGPLQDNGGPTFTHALLPSSPAIDAGDPNFVGPPDYDQRGPNYFRVRGGRIDVGSFEVQNPPSPTATPTPRLVPTPRSRPSPVPRPTP